MKFRKDFVTNSSSSSYICDICGEVNSGYDISLSECNMMECQNGHVFCCHEALELPSKEAMIKTILENEWNKQVWNYDLDEYMDYSETDLLNIDDDTLFERFMSDGGYYEVPECVCPICQFIEYLECDLSAYLLKKYQIPKEEVFNNEIKKFNNRRKHIYDIEYITYICKKFDLNPAEIVSNWKKEFKSYADFSNWITSN